MGSTGAGGWWEAPAQKFPSKPLNFPLLQQPQLLCCAALYYKNLKKHQPHKNRERRGVQERCGAGRGRGRGREEGKTGKLGHSVMYTPVYFRVMTEGGTVGGLI